MDLPFGSHLIGDAYWSGLEIVPVILFGYLFYGMYVNFMAGIYIEKKTKYLPLITGLGAAINVISNFILIPKLSFMGAAISTLISYFVMMAGIYIVSQKFYKVNYEYKKIGIIFTSLISVTAIYFILNSYMEIKWIIKIVFPVIYILIIYFTGIFNKNVIKKFM